MKNRLYLLGFAALTLIPTAAMAQNANIGVQESSNSAVVVGSGNSVNQRNNQSNIQNNVNSGRTRSIQQSRNEAAVFGNYNIINQNAQQHNRQNQYRQNAKDPYNSYFNR